MSTRTKMGYYNKLLFKKNANSPNQAQFSTFNHHPSLFHQP